MKAASKWLVTETREGSSREHFVLSSWWLLGLFKMGCLTSLASLDMRESRLGATQRLR